MVYRDFQWLIALIDPPPSGVFRPSYLVPNSWSFQCQIAVVLQPATFNAPENQTVVGTVAASDSDTGNDYVVVVRATSGTGAWVKTAEVTITVTVTDVGGEAPGVPAAPVVSPASVTSLPATWTAPANAGPPITDYDYRHRVTLPQGSWTEVTTTTITGLGTTIEGLADVTSQ